MNDDDGTRRRVMDDMMGRMVIVKDPHVCASARADRQPVYKITSLAFDGNYLYTDDIRCCRLCWYTTVCDGCHDGV